MALIDDIRGVEGLKLAFILDIGGLVQLYTMGPPGADFGVPAPTREYVGGILHISPIESRFPTLGGVGEAGGVTITLFDDGTESGVGAVMDRCTPRGAGMATRLFASNAYPDGIPTTDPLVPDEVHTEDDPTALGWTAPGRFYVGQEAFEFTAILAGAGTAANPYGFDGVTRAWRNSRLQAHRIDAQQGWAPDVTDVIVSWRTRPAVLYCARVYDTGEVSSSWIQLVNGFIDTMPREVEPLRYELTIKPWIAALDTKVGGEKSTVGLSHGWRWFQWPEACRMTHRQRWDEGAAVDVVTEAANNAGDLFLTANYASHDDIFDIVTHAGTNDARRGVIKVPSAGLTNLEPNGYTAGPPPQFDFAGAIGTATRISSRVVNAAAETFHEVTFLSSGGAIFRWPEDILDAIENAWTPTTVDGAAGQWADLWVEADPNGEGPHVATKLNCEENAQPLQIIVQPLPDHLHFGLDLAARDDPQEVEIDPRAPGAGTAWQHRWATDAKRDEPMSGRHLQPIRRLLAAFWQTGEQYLSVDRDPSPTYPVALRIDPPDGVVRYMVVNSSTAMLVGGVTVGYRLEVDDDWRWRVRSFGDEYGGPRTKIRPVVAFRRTDPRTVVLTALESAEGDGTRGTYDTGVYGAGIDQLFIDEDGFDRYAVPAGVQEWTLQFGEERTIKETVEPILQAMMAALVPRLNPETGERLLAPVRAGMEVWTEAVDAIADDEWVGHVLSSWNEETTNFWRFRLNYDDATGEHQVVVDYRYRDAAKEIEEVHEQESDLRGLEADPRSPAAQQGLLRPIFFERRNVVGRPRRVYRGTVPFDVAVGLFEGAIVTVTSSDARRYDGTRGVTAVPMRVTAIKLDPMPPGECELELEWHGAPTTGWAPALRVSAVPAVDEVEVEANAYTESTDPIFDDAQQDLDFWAVNDSARCVPRGSWSGTTLTVSSINTATRRVVLSGAHGLAIGDTIRPGPYTGATTDQRRYAFQASAAGELNAGADDGFEWA